MCPRVRVTAALLSVLRGAAFLVLGSFATPVSHSVEAAPSPTPTRTPTRTPVTVTGVPDSRLTRPTNTPTPLAVTVVTGKSAPLNVIDTEADGVAFGGDATVDTKRMVRFGTAKTLPDGIGSAASSGHCSVPVYAFVYGRGNTGAANVVARVTVEGETFDSAPATALPSVLFLLKVPARLKMGTHTLKLELDPDHKVPDVNRANNVGSLTYTLNTCGPPLIIIPLPTPKK